MEHTPTSSCRSAGIILVALLFLWPGTDPLQAQQQWRIELRPSLQFPVHSVNGDKIGPGPGLEAGLTHMFSPLWGAHAGVGYGQFDRYGEGDAYYEEAGAHLGIRLFQPMIGPLQAMLGGGTIYHRLAMKEGNGVRLAASDLGFGWQVEGGFVMAFDDRWSLAPSVRYRSLSRNFDLADANERVDLDHVSASVVFAIHF
jgi:hypothetical protein